MHRRFPPECLYLQAQWLPGWAMMTAARNANADSTNAARSNIPPPHPTPPHPTPPRPGRICRPAAWLDWPAMRHRPSAIHQSVHARKRCAMLHAWAVQEAHLCQGDRRMAAIAPLPRQLQLVMQVREISLELAHEARGQGVWDCIRRRNDARQALCLCYMVGFHGEEVVQQSCDVAPATCHKGHAPLDCGTCELGLLGHAAGWRPKSMHLGAAGCAAFQPDSGGRRVNAVQVQSTVWLTAKPGLQGKTASVSYWYHAARAPPLREAEPHLVR